MNRWKEAASSARDAIRADSSYVKAHSHLSKSLLQLGLVKDAREALEAGIQAVQPDSEKVILWR